MKPKIIYSLFLLITIFLAIPKATKANMIPNNSQILEISRNLRDRPDFFEEGKQQFEEEIKRMEKERPDPVLTIENANLKWQNFIFAEQISLKIDPANQRLDPLESSQLISAELLAFFDSFELN